jgi:hypothetical protein
MGDIFENMNKFKKKSEVITWIFDLVKLHLLHMQNFHVKSNVV